MPWFKLDDSFHHHPKVVAAGNSGTGLWVRAATWSSEYLTDGEIPRSVVEAMGSRSEIERVSNSRLWVPMEESFLLPDWSEYQPSALEVRTRRAHHAERMREWRRGRGDSS